MRIVIAPDSFKGSVNSAIAAFAIATGVRRAAPDADIDCVPMADGGEGTLDILIHALHGQRRQIDATGPLGERRTAVVGLIDRAATAVIELASVAGLPLVPVDRRDPLRTTTFGVGELIRAALDAGVERILLAAGGSATVDGGAGMLQALGAVLVDNARRIAPPGIGGGGLADVEEIRVEGLDPRLTETRITVAVDVLNPLCGPNGAAAVFAPQKGADAAAVAKLEAGLSHWADLLEARSGRSIRHEPGSGAAGGVAAPLIALADADVVPGVDVVIDAVRLAERLSGAELCITGEGRLDAQSAMGKVVGGVARLAAAMDVPCAAVVGSVGPGVDAIRSLLTCWQTATDAAGSAAAAMREPQHWLAIAAEKLIRSRA